MGGRKEGLQGWGWGRGQKQGREVPRVYGAAHDKRVKINGTD